jgi:hypothetical protein
MVGQGKEAAAPQLSLDRAHSPQVMMPPMHRRLRMVLSLIIAGPSTLAILWLFAQLYRMMWDLQRIANEQLSVP